MSSELVCNFCGKQFSSETLLNDHNRDVHTKIESPCNLCDKSFRGNKKLRYHITSTHAEKEAFQCDIKSVGIQCTYSSKDDVDDDDDDDPKCWEETAEYDGAPQKLSQLFI